MRRTLRYLRIAVTALSLTACLLLIALWVRSYQSTVFVHGPLPDTLGSLLVETSEGRLTFCVAYAQRLQSGTLAHESFWGLHHKSIEEWEPVVPGLRSRSSFSLFKWKGNLYFFILPYWFLTLFMLAVAALLFWMNSLNFSLRTLLIATTLVAVALGVIVYASR